MFLVVWSIYLSDRLFDVAHCRDWGKATGRLCFGRNNQSFLVVCLVLCVLSILALLWAGLPTEVIRRAAAVGVGVGLHFSVFVNPLFLRKRLLGKEFGVGVFFALGAYACLGATAETLPLLGAIALVVTFNCLIIAARDDESDRANDPGGASWWWRTIDRDLVLIGVSLALTTIVIGILCQHTAFYWSLAGAFTVLTVLHLYARRLSGDAVRAMADFALFTPIPVMGFMT